MKEKVIIAVVGKSNSGKTAAIRKLAECLPFSEEKKFLWGKLEDRFEDFSFFADYISPSGGETKKIGICSLGDYIRNGLEDVFLPLVKDYHCDLIVVPCHNYRDVIGNTFKYLEDVARENDYKLLTTSIISDHSVTEMPLNEWVANGNGEIQVNGVILNEIFAQNMINLINALL